MTRKNKKSQSLSNLPIFMYKGKILESIKNHQVVIIIGKTGCGKSTQVPQYLFESGYSKNGNIACLHPRCVAAMSLAERVSLELNKPIGGLVGYQVRFYKQLSHETKILFMTTGSMLMMMRDDKFIDSFSIVIIDEAHERSVQTDLMMGFMKETLVKKKFIKLVIMSATLNVDQIKNYYNNCAVISISNVSDKIKTIYRPLKSENYIAAIKEIVEEIVEISKKGHILIFLQSEEKVMKCRKQLGNLRSTRCLPFYAGMDEVDKYRVFDEYPKNLRKIIIATNLAETSLTIPGVDYVIDSGLVKRVVYDYETGVEKWMTKYISIAEANQRKGRTGRTGFGTCYRLYNEKSVISNTVDLSANLAALQLTNENSSTLFPSKNFHKHIQQFQEFPEPEIKTVNLSSMTLTLKSMNWNDILKFPFIVKPEDFKINKSLTELEDLSLLNQFQQLTKIGKIASGLPLEPRLGKVATVAAELPCAQDVYKIISMLCVRNVIKSSSGHDSENGDLFRLLNVFNEANDNWHDRKWFQDNHIDRARINYAYKVFNQLQHVLQFHSTYTNYYCHKSNENLVKKAFLSGFFQNIARRSDKLKYSSVDNKTLSVHNSSCLDKSAEFIFFQSIQKSQKEEIIIRFCTSLNEQMLKSLKPQKYKIKAPLWNAIVEKQLK